MYSLLFEIVLMPQSKDRYMIPRGGKTKRSM